MRSSHEMICQKQIINSQTKKYEKTKKIYNFCGIFTIQNQDRTVRKQNLHKQQSTEITNNRDIKEMTLNKLQCIPKDWTFIPSINDLNI